MKTIRLTAIYMLLQVLVQDVFSAPYHDTTNQNQLQNNCLQCTLKHTNSQELQENQRLSGKASKKDVFVSRGWGAGGMPFSVLYMNHSYSSKAPVTVVTADKSQQAPREQPKSVPRVRNSMQSRLRSRHRVSHSVIPQLFVSYGWGPHGKK